MRAVKTRRSPAKLHNPAHFAGFSAGVQYPAAYQQQTIGKAKPASVALSQLQQQQEQQQQQQYLAQQQQLLQLQQQQQAPLNLPSYADQMQAAFLDYQRQRMEFEQQQQQLLQKLYTYYPDVSGQQQHQLQHELPHSQQQQQQQQQQANTINNDGSRFFSRQAFGSNNGLQPQPQPQPQQRQQTQQQPAQLPQLSQLPQLAQLPQQAQPAAPAGGLANFYSTQQHMGFMQQQQQNVLRDQQQNVAQQFATGQLAPSTSTNYGMAVPDSPELAAAAYQPASAVSHVRFSSGNLNYNF
ncbi:putative uncharacterized protein DDB_G0271606 isoform X2 [Drosophila navojoa]|uniref:putative uncharacterized protein DDB_G0271606 isoform X2 n=1 Tax=Drosophila navojoa TaxID=7232 RepID=UPI0011BEC5D7|nr:putative uncharacterized protein DDB_G0271606 isoform X2 [Drosophila navojoa]